jgi:hypothetical protein
LRRSIKQVIANFGHPDVLLHPYERAFRRARPMLEAARDDQPEADARTMRNGGS